MSKTAISTKIKASLETLKGTDKPLVDVYAHHTTKTTGYPYATFEPSDIASDYETTTQNMRKYVFRIMVHQQFSTIGKAEAIAITNTASDAIVSMFEKDWTLGGTVDFVEVAPSVDGDYDTETNTVHMTEVMLAVQKSISII